MTTKKRKPAVKKAGRKKVTLKVAASSGDKNHIPLSILRARLVRLSGIVERRRGPSKVTLSRKSSSK